MCMIRLSPCWLPHRLQVTRHFPSSLGVDDFIARLEIALFAYGFTGDNSIGPPLPPDMSVMRMPTSRRTVHTGSM